MQPWLAVTAPHGLTDVFLAPGPALGAHAFSALAVANLPDERLRIGLLIPFSIVHMRTDYGGLRNSVLVHAAWVACPPLAVACLSVYHTPRHYAKTFPLIEPPHRLAAAGLCILATACCLGLPDVVEIFAGHAMWVAPVVAHIIFTEWMPKPIVP
jgi:hypothetical protein